MKNPNRTDSWDNYPTLGDILKAALQQKQEPTKMSNLVIKNPEAIAALVRFVATTVQSQNVGQPCLIQQIKQLRTVTGFDLYESKMLMEAAINKPSDPVLRMIADLAERRNETSGR